MKLSNQRDGTNMFKEIGIILKRKRLATTKIIFERKLSFHNFRTARNCLLFWMNGDIVSEEAMKLKGVLARSMETTVLVFSPLKKKLERDIREAVYVNEDSVSFGGRFVDDKLKKIVGNSFDLLIDLSVKKDSFGDYIVRNSRAKCKIGMERDGFENDIVLDGVKGIEDFTGRLNDLLSNIKTY